MGLLDSSRRGASPDRDGLMSEREWFSGWRGRRRFDKQFPSSIVMAAAASSSSAAAPPQVHQLEVACAELKSLHETRAVYEKRGTIFFRTTVKAAAKSQLQELEIAKARAKNSAS